MNRRPIINMLAVSLIMAPLACEEVNFALPSESEAGAHYANSSDLSVSLNGNVVEVTVDQPFPQVRRGGSLWAKVGPYIYLFTNETESLLRRYPAVSGVRVITRTGRSNAEVARAFLHRDSLNELTWRWARNIAGRARIEGTRRPVLLEELVEWGQDHTEFGYNQDFIG